MPQRTFGEAVERLQAAQKSGAGVPAYLRWVNRPAGRRLAALAYLLRLTPNHVTALSGLVSLVGVLLIAVLDPTWLVSTVATLALLVGYALDSADGQLARLLGGGGPAGEFVDHVVDAVRQPLVHLGIAGSLYFRADLEQTWPALVALGFSVLTSAWFFAQILADKLLPSGSRSPGAQAPAWMSFVKAPYDVGTLYLLVLLLPLATLFVALYTALAVFTLAVAALSVRRKYVALVAVSVAA